jgi:FkbM family methyltransferase
MTTQKHTFPDRIKLAILASVAAILRLPYMRGRVTISELFYRMLKPSNAKTAMIVSGRPIYVDLAERELRYVYFGAFEVAERSFLEWSLRPGDVVIDVGANVGFLSAVMLSKIEPGGTLYAFEPQPELLAGLRQLQASSDGMMELMPFAVGAAGSESSPQKLEFYCNPEHSMWGSLVEGNEYSDNPKMIRVNVISLANFFEDRNIRKVDLIKIDVEGFESEVLVGLIESLDRVGSPAILCEIAPVPESNFQASLEAINELVARGYSIWSLDRKGMPVAGAIDTISSIKVVTNFVFATGNWMNARSK